MNWLKIKNTFICHLCLFGFVLVLSCGQSMGDRVDIDNLKVYYLPPFEKDNAINFAKFWRDNGFLGETPQFIQLSISENDIIQVRVIEKESYHEQGLTIEEQALLSELERRLEKEVFTKRVSLIITDNTFAAIDRASSKSH